MSLHCPLALPRTDALLLKLSLLVGQEVFYGALWGSMLVSPLVRLPATVFIVTHFDRMLTLHQQAYMLGYDHRLVVSVFVILLTCAAKNILNIFSWVHLFHHVSVSTLLYAITIFCQLFELLGLCLSPGEVSVSLSTRF